MKMRNILGLISLALWPVATNAQIYQDADNSTAVIVRDPARQASTEIDAVIYNPAGTAFLKEGLTFSLNVNSSIQNIENSASYQAGTSKSKTWNLMPSLQMAYKTGKWTLSGSFAQESGYGMLKNKDGIPFAVDPAGSSLLAINSELSLIQAKEAIIGVLNPDFTPFSLPNDEFRVNVSNSQSDTRNFAIRLGGAYQINDELSAYLGVRINYFTHRNKMNYTLAMYRPSTNESWSPSEYFSKCADAYHVASQNMSGDKRQSYEDMAALYDLLVTSSVEGPNMHRENGVGVAPVIGVNYHTKGVNIGAKYEFQTHVYTTDGYSAFNIPSMLSLGGDVQIMKNLKCAVGANLHFKTSDVYGVNSVIDSENIHTELTSDVQNKVCYDLAASLSYTCLDRLTCSAGWSYHKKGFLVNNGYMDVFIGNKFDYQSLSFGMRYSISDKLALDAGCSFDFRKHDITNFNNITSIDNNSKSCDYYNVKNGARLALGLSYNL